MFFQDKALGRQPMATHEVTTPSAETLLKSVFDIVARDNVPGVTLCYDKAQGRVTLAARNSDKSHAAAFSHLSDDLARMKIEDLVSTAFRLGNHTSSTHLAKPHAFVIKDPAKAVRYRMQWIPKGPIFALVPRGPKSPGMLLIKPIFDMAAIPG
jgi:hypothetical protein